MNSELGDVWIFTPSVLSVIPVPLVEHYKLISQREKSITVMKYGRPLVIKRECGRQFFTDEESFKTGMKNFLECKKTSLLNQIRDIDAHIEKGFRVFEIPAEKEVWSNEIEL